jgi:undecaprenyl diphosphate synthase
MTILTRLKAARTALRLGQPEGSGRPEAPLGGRETPRSVAIIMDGNGRWAERRGLPVAAGHSAGAKALKRVVRAAGDAGIDDLTVFSFSTENWGRPADEVEELMSLFCDQIDNEVPELVDERVQIRFIGRREQLATRLQERMEAAEAATADGERLRLFVAMNYGGRQEIVDAARRFVDGYGLDAGEDEFAQCLYSPDLRDPELVIRTSGEQRISNFLLWQSAYAEFYFSDRLWPDFGPEDLLDAVAHYTSRERRFGGR